MSRGTVLRMGEVKGPAKAWLVSLLGSAATDDAEVRISLKRPASSIPSRPWTTELNNRRCDLIGNPFEDSLGGQQRQSLGFANLIAGVRQRTNGAITVVMDNASVPRTASAYPARTESLTAGEWNRAAAANNRVEFFAESGAAPSGVTP